MTLEERWSNLQFEESWVDAMVIWTVKKNVGNRWLLKWDKDEETVSWETEYFLKEDDDTPVQGIPNYFIHFCKVFLKIISQFLIKQQNDYFQNSFSLEF